MGNCVVCGRMVDWTFVKGEFVEILEQADRYGVDSLNEAQQVVYEGMCCSINCYIKLDQKGGNTMTDPTRMSPRDELRAEVLRVVSDMFMTISDPDMSMKNKYETLTEAYIPKLFALCMED